MLKIKNRFELLSIVRVFASFPILGFAFTPNQVVSTGCVVIHEVEACSIVGLSVPCGSGACLHEVLSSEMLARCQPTHSAEVGFQGCEADTSRIAALCHMRLWKCGTHGVCVMTGRIHFRYYIQEKGTGGACGPS